MRTAACASGSDARSPVRSRSAPPRAGATHRPPKDRRRRHTGWGCCSWRHERRSHHRPLPRSPRRATPPPLDRADAPLPSRRPVRHRSSGPERARGRAHRARRARRSRRDARTRRATVRPMRRARVRLRAPDGGTRTSSRARRTGPRRWSRIAYRGARRAPPLRAASPPHPRPERPSRAARTWRHRASSVRGRGRSALAACAQSSRSSRTCPRT